MKFMSFPSELHPVCNSAKSNYMKRIILVVFSLVLLSASAWSQRKMAFMVAIGKYPPGGRWGNLSSANDMYYIKQALLKNGFLEANMDSLKDEQATKAAIVARLDAFIEKLKDGDIVYFHFSGHGQQIEDDNGDEVDGYDEALVPYDAKAMYDMVTYKGQNHLRDDLLNEKFTRIRERIGKNGSFIVLIDACHSGTASRGTEYRVSRGLPSPFQSPGYKPKEQLKIGGSSARELGFLNPSSVNLGNMIVISASSPSQVNYETKDANNVGVGSLSFAFAKAISNLKEGENYSLLFEKIRAQIQADIPTQVPMIEGNTDQLIFNGAYSPKMELLTSQRWLHDSAFTVNIGYMQGIGNGSTVKILDASKQVITTGVIQQANPFQSICVAAKALDKQQVYIVELDAVQYGSFSATVFIPNVAPKETKLVELVNQLKQKVKDYPFLQMSENADMMIEVKWVDMQTRMIRLVDMFDSTRYVKTYTGNAALTDDDWKFFMEGIKRLARVKYFRNIQDGGALAQGVKMEVIPRSKPQEAGDLLMKPLDLFDLRITNNSPFGVYFTLVNIMPNNDVKVLLPDEFEEPQDYFLRPGESRVIEEVQVDEDTPEGKEFFKLILSRSPMDLRGVLNRKKTRSAGGNMQTFEQVMDDMFSESVGQKNTRSSMSKMKLDEVGIVTTGFIIERKK